MWTELGQGTISLGLAWLAAGDRDTVLVVISHLFDIRVTLKAVRQPRTERVELQTFIGCIVIFNYIVHGVTVLGCTISVSLGDRPCRLLELGPKDIVARRTTRSVREMMLVYHDGYMQTRSHV